MGEPGQLFLGEFLGTMILILLGDGVVAGVLLGKSKSENAGWVAITAGWAFAVMCGIFTASAIGGPSAGALNPVFPIADLILNPYADLRTGMILIGAEFAGAFVGAVLVWLHYLPHWRVTDDAGKKLAVFCTSPAIRSGVANLMSEVIGTFVFVLVALAMGSFFLTNAGMKPPVVGGVIWGIGLCLGGTTGFAINPARDLSPRLAHFILPIPGKGGSDWAYAWVPVVGPVIGGVLGAVLLKAFD